MKLVVGLGNPGKKYAGTKHNVGFDVLDRLAGRSGAGSRKSGFQGEILDVPLRSERGLLLWPQTYMNKSGTSVGQAVQFYKLDLADVLIVCDDFNLPLGKLRLRTGGSAGGQKGLADIIRQLGTDQVPRLRVGIGAPPGSGDAADFVLGKFNKQQQQEIDVAVAEAADAVVAWAADGIATAMNQYNRSTSD
ncbi:MAG: aminoacyl-tRNA hydrolase [Planctomycetaceae bacterium]|nr:aminoacyl-tRNA hydrolase [Planctomycetaceae bacterium]